MEREIFSLSESDKEMISINKPIICSSDNRFLICCKQTILVITISCDLDSCSDSLSKNDPFKLFVRRIADISTLPTFCINKGVLNLAESLLKMSDHEKNELLIDTCLGTKSVLPTVSLGGFRQAAFSPRCNFVCGLFIATVTSDHRVLIFRESQSREWTMSYELTKQLKEHITASFDLPVTVGNDMSFLQYKNLVYSMCCVELTWSSSFQNKDSLASCQESLLLFCGMRNGDVLMWETKNSVDLALDANAFKFIAKDEYTSEVTSLGWYSMTLQHGFLALGYMDGNIRILKVLQTVDGDKRFDMKEMFFHNLKDDLSVFDLAFTQMDNKTSILVACKQFYAGIYSLQDGRIEHVRTIHMECSLPLVSVSLFGSFGAIASQDGAIFHLDFGLELNQISVQHSMLKITCLPEASHISWSCKGLTLSENGALCLSIHNPLSDFPLKCSGRVRSTDRQKVILSLTPKFLKENFILPPTCQSTWAYVSTVDITARLLLILKNARSNNQSLEMVEDILEELIASKRVENLQVAKAVHFFEFFKIQVAAVQFQVLRFSSEKRSSELDEMILVKHISNCLLWAMEKDEDLDQLTSMYQWVTSNEKRRNLLSEDVSLDTVSNFMKREKLRKYYCILCESELVTFKDLLYIECVNGHKTPLCCLTLIPINGPYFRHCQSCQTAALNAHDLEDIDAHPFIKTKDVCTLCGGELQ